MAKGYRAHIGQTRHTRCQYKGWATKKERTHQTVSREAEGCMLKGEGWAAQEEQKTAVAGMAGEHKGGKNGGGGPEEWEQWPNGEHRGLESSRQQGGIATQ